MNTKTIMDPNLIVFVQLILDAVAEGWTIDSQNPPTLLGFCYHVIVQREDEPPAAKPSRAEILAKARAAKAAKAAADAAGTLAAPLTADADVVDAILAAEGDEEATEPPAEAPSEPAADPAPADEAK